MCGATVLSREVPLSPTIHSAFSAHKAPTLLRSAHVIEGAARAPAARAHKQRLLLAAEPDIDWLFLRLGAGERAAGTTTST